MNNNKQNWLDDPEWDDLVERVKHQSAKDIQKNRQTLSQKKRQVEPEADLSEEPKEIQLKINLSIPPSVVNKLKRLQGRLKKLKTRLAKSQKRQWRLAGLAVVGFVLLVGGISVLVKQNQKTASNNPSGLSQSAGQGEVVSHEPPFEIVKPLGRDIPSDKISYSTERNFVKYEDELNGFKLSVSQQLLPDNFKNDPQGEIKKLADQLGAKLEFGINDNPLYYSLSDQGLQTVILIKNERLIFINSSQKIGKETLKNYANYLN